MSSPWAASNLVQLTMRPPPAMRRHGSDCPTERPGPEHAPIAQQQPDTVVPLALSGLKPGHGKGSVQCVTQIMSNNCMHFDTVVNHRPVISEKYAAVLSVLVKEFENVSRLEKKNNF